MKLQNMIIDLWVQMINEPMMYKTVAIEIRCQAGQKCLAAWKNCYIVSASQPCPASQVRYSLKIILKKGMTHIYLCFHNEAAHFQLWAALHNSIVRLKK